MKRIRNAVLQWLPLAVSLVLFSGLVYAVLQQSLRSGAEEPQVQMAEDAARQLETQPAETVLPVKMIELSESLSAYLMVFNAQGSLLSSSARLHGQIPEFPPGPLEYARTHGENRITWQPEAGVRSAVVVVPVAGGEKGYVLAGRSLREIERRIQMETQLVGAGLVASLLASLAAVLVTEWLRGAYRVE